jgi:hypothetical protein
MYLAPVTGMEGVLGTRLTYAFLSLRKSLTARTKLAIPGPMALGTRDDMVGNAWTPEEERRTVEVVYEKEVALGEEAVVCCSEAADVLLNPRHPALIYTSCAPSQQGQLQYHPTSKLNRSDSIPIQATLNHPTFAVRRAALHFKSEA